MMLRGSCVLTLLFLLGCDKRNINAEAALPAPGTSLRAFSFPAHGSADSVRSASFAGRPIVLALWSTHCPFQGPWVAALDSLAREYVPRGVRVVVLADDAAGRVLDSALAAATWPHAVTAIGVANGALQALFDNSGNALERSTERVEFVLPSFLLIGPNGRVIRRAFGPTSRFRPTLDSLVGPASTALGRPAV